MKFKVIVTVDMGVDSKAEIEHELRVLEEITGIVPKTCEENGVRGVVFEGEFHEFYQKIKDRIMRKIKAYE